MSEFNEKSEGFQTRPTEKKRKKFATQMDEQLLADIRAFAKKEGRQLQAVLEDAVDAYLKDKRGYVMDPRVKAAHDHVLKKYNDVFVELAK